MMGVLVAVLAAVAGALIVYAPIMLCLRLMEVFISFVPTRDKRDKEE